MKCSLPKTNNINKKKLKITNEKTILTQFLTELKILNKHLEISCRYVDRNIEVNVDTDIN